MMEVISSHESKGMFESYFGFRESPFGVTPDPRFFYGSPLYLEGWAALVYVSKPRKGSCSSQEKWEQARRFFCASLCVSLNLSGIYFHLQQPYYFLRAR
jgi:hypothetical protein